MNKEIEAKYRLTDFASLRERLSAAGARRVGSVLEVNRIYDSHDGKLRESGRGLRLRINRSAADKGEETAVLTYKGPRESGQLKIREEVETEVTDPAACMTLLQRLGFHEIVLYEKRRETWHLRDCEICLDELPELGCFAEIEGPSVAEVISLGESLGLTEAMMIRQTYVGMVYRQGQTDSTGIKHLTFAE